MYTPWKRMTWRTVALVSRTSTQHEVASATVTGHTTSCIKPHPTQFSEVYKTNYKQKQRLQENPKPLLYLCPPELPWQKFLHAYDLPWRAWKDSRSLVAVCHSALQVRDLCSLPYRKPLTVIFQAIVYSLSLRKIHNLKLERVSCSAGTGQCPAASQWMLPNDFAPCPILHGLSIYSL